MNVLNWLFGPKMTPLSDAQVRRVPTERDWRAVWARDRAAILAEAQALTGVRYAGRTAIEDARAIAARQRRLTQTDRLARQYQTRVAQTPPKPSAVKPVYVRHAKNGRVAHTRALPGKGTK